MAAAWGGIAIEDLAPVVSEVCAAATSGKQARTMKGVSRGASGISGELDTQRSTLALNETLRSELESGAGMGGTGVPGAGASASRVF